jgi:hypothetical protein
MTDRKFVFTIEQIKDIFDAGRRRGSDEECSYQCGSSATGRQYDECASAVHDIINDGKNWGESDYTNFDTVDSWFK